MSRLPPQPVPLGAPEQTLPPCKYRPLAPGVWPWFIVYCVAMALMYLFVAGIGLVFFFVDPGAMEMEPLEAMALGVIYSGLGLSLCVVFAVAPFLPRRKWVWIYDLVVICLGMTSCCTLPACVALLIFWIRPETRHFFRWL